MRKRFVASRRDFIGALGFGLVSAPGCAEAAAAISVLDFGAAGNGADDDTAAIRRALGAHRAVSFPAGTFRITAALELNQGQSITLSPGTVIRQERADTPIFYALRKHDLVFRCNGATLQGEGTYRGGADTPASSRWTSNGDRLDQAFRLVGCDRFLIERPRILNCGHAGICLFGGTGGRILGPVIEGTHTHGAPLVNDIPGGYYASYQLGIFIVHTAPGSYGAVEGLEVRGADISGTAIGVLTECHAGAPEPATALRFHDTRFHDIPGQHGFYIQSSRTQIAGVEASGLRLATIKLQTVDLDIRDFSATGVRARDCGSQVFEIATAGRGAGSIRNVRLEGEGLRVQRLLSVTRNVENLVARVTGAEIADLAVQLSGDALHDIEVQVDARDIGSDGVLITATRSDRIRIRPTIRNANAARGPLGCGIRVVSDSAVVEIIGADVRDENRRMRYGLINEVAGSVVLLRGTARFTGAAETALRATGRIVGLPANSILEGARGALTNPGNISRANAD